MKKTEWINYRYAAGVAKRCKWPSEIRRLETPERITLTLEKPSYETISGLDAWGMACRGAFVSKHADACPDVLFEINGKPDTLQIESLKRRLSYLNHVNSFGVSLKLNGKTVTLYGVEDMMTLAEREIIIHDDLNPRSAEDPATAAAKTLQEYLYDPNGVITELKAYLRELTLGRCPAHCCKGEVLRAIAEFEKDYLKVKGKSSRFSVLGEDFGGKKAFGVLRGFNTGAFKKHGKGEVPVLPTGTIDFVTLNRYRQLALVDLKLDDATLDVLTRALNHALFFQLYRAQITKTAAILDTVGTKVEEQGFVCYIARNNYHPLFDLAAQYYSPGKPFDFEIKQVILGETRELSENGDAGRPR